MVLKQKLSKGMKFFIFLTNLILILASLFLAIYFIYNKSYLFGAILILIFLIWSYIIKKDWYYVQKTGRLTGKLTRKGKKI